MVSLAAAAAAAAAARCGNSARGREMDRGSGVFVKWDYAPIFHTLTVFCYWLISR